MTRAEIIDVLKRNIDKPVRIVYTTGDVRSVVPIGVDTLGFVYDVEEAGNVEAFFEVSPSGVTSCPGKRFRKRIAAAEPEPDAATRSTPCQSTAIPCEIAQSPAQASKQLRDIGAQLPGERHAASPILWPAPLAKIPAFAPTAER